MPRFSTQTCHIFAFGYTVNLFKVLFSKQYFQKIYEFVVVCVSMFILVLIAAI